MRLFYEPTQTLNPDELENSFRAYVSTPSNNVLGFREAPINDDIVQDDYKRILFLGDSFTQGRGVENGEDRFSDVIERRLNEQDVSFKYHIYNAGVGGTEPDEWVQYLRTLLPIYKPQYVFAIFFLRDGTGLCTSLLCYKEKIMSLRRKYENNLFYSYTYLGKHIANKQVEEQFSDYYISRMINSYLGSEAEKAPWIEQQKYLLEILNACKKEDTKFFLVIFPVLFGLESASHYKFYGIEEEIGRFAKENGIPMFSLTEGFIGHESDTLWVSASDQHPNETGHLIAADTLYPFLKDILTR